MSFNTVWQEKMESREVDIGRSDPQGKLILYGINTVAVDDDTDANLSLVNTLPLVFPGYFYAALTFKSYQLKNAGGGLWEATALYTRQDPLFNFDTGSGTQKITQAIFQRGVYGVSGAIHVLSSETTVGSTTVAIAGIDTTAGVTAGDTVTDTNGAIPGGTTVSSVTDSTHLVLSAAATKTTGNPVSLPCALNLGTAAVTVLPSPTLYTLAITNGSTTAIIVEPDDTDLIQTGDAVIPTVVGAGIAGGTTVSAVVDFETITLSVPATASGEITVGIGNDGDTGLIRVGESISGPGVPAGTTVSAIADATHFTMSNNATASSDPAFGVVLTFGELELLTFTPVTNPPPDFKGAINVKDDSVEGVDVEVPSGHFEITYHLSPALLTQDYELLLEQMTGCVNSDTFRGRQPGECKFLGARGSQKGLEDAEITFRFAASPNKANFMVGDITVAQKLGWDYLWVRYQKQIDSGSGLMFDVPQFVVIDQVFPMVPFSQLRIGN